MSTHSHRLLSALLPKATHSITSELVEVGLIDLRLGDFVEVGEGPEGTRMVVDVPEVPTADQTGTPAEDTTPDRQRDRKGAGFIII